MIDEIHKYSGFRLLELEFINNKVFGTLKFNFVDELDNDEKFNYVNDINNYEKFYTTVIIGANGTRKSNLLKTIIRLFRQIYEYKNNFPITDPVTGSFYLKYSLNGDIFEFRNFLRDDDNLSPGKTSKIEVSITKNGNSCKTNADIETPLSISASSMMVNDKFPFVRKEGFEIFNYLGIRNTPQSANTTSHVRKTVEFIVNTLDIPALIIGIRKVVNELLEINYQPTIIYRTINTSIFFSGDLDEAKFDQYFDDIIIKYQQSETSAPYKTDHYLTNFKESSEDKNELIEYCNNIVRTNRLVDVPNSSAKKIRFNIMEENDIKQLRKEYETIEILRKLGIINPPTIDFILPNNNSSKDQESVLNMSEISSGEYNIFTSFISLMANIKVNSLVLTDEPEVSLHPNWQMKYLDFMRKLFSNEYYKTCHFIIATHSHFFVSDLEGRGSTIIGLKRNKNNHSTIPSLPDGINTFGWSAEEVLYSIFNVRSTRNSFFEYDLTKITSLINRNSKDYDSIRKLVEKFSIIKISESDPLNIILEKANNYLEKNA